MNESFSTLFNTRLLELIDGLEYDHKPTPGETKAPTIITPMLPARTGDHTEGETHPYIRWAIHRGVFRHIQPSSFWIFIQVGIYTAGDIDDGVRDITALTIALGQIAEKRSFPPYVLSVKEGEEPSFIIGDLRDGSEGLQPHPYYYSQIRLKFVTSTNHKP